MKRFAILSAVSAFAASIAAPVLALPSPIYSSLPDPIAFTPTAAVPEPATWVSMIIGFAAVGIAIRVRKAIRAKA
jgi:hypothetical protein